MSRFKELSFPLRATLVSAVILSALLGTFFTVGVVGVPSYFAIRKAVKNLWIDLAKQSSQTGVEEVLRYFQNAPTTLKMIDGLIEEGVIELNSKEKLFDICYRALKENPNFTTVFYTTIEGDFTGVFKIDGAFKASFRSFDEKGKTRVENYKETSGKWKLENVETSDYDPRKRPFWKTGEAHPEGAWTDVYRFVTTKDLGYSFTLAQRDATETIEGFWTVDFQIDNLGQFLDSLDLGIQGSVYILDNQGIPIAQSIREIPGGKTNLPKLLESAWKDHFENNDKSQSVQIGHLIFYANRFPNSSGIPWSLLTVIHEQDFLLPIRNKALFFLSLGTIPLLFFLIISALFFGRISKRLKEIAAEMDEAGNLTIRSYPQDYTHSHIREINLMNKSLNKMKIGFQSFLKYVPVDLVKKLLESGQAATLGGEKKEITVLFADLTQFTSISELLDPKETASILKDFLSAASLEIHKEKGIIDKFMGDAVMALWGAPEPHPDHALAACRMALALKKFAAHHPLMKHKVGINSGTAMVGNFGSEERMDYTVIGDAVNIASRLEKLNSYYETQILIGEETADMTQTHFLMRPIDYVVLKGRKQSHLIYELIDQKSSDNSPLAPAIEKYTSALIHYRESKFVEAVSLFKEAIQLYGGTDKPSSILIERCLEFKKIPPPKNWNGASIGSET